MKRILCPECDQYVVFDETKQEPGCPVGLVCRRCGHPFTLRLRKKNSPEPNTAAHAKSEVAIRPTDEGFGYITVIENGFGYKQELPLAPGDNIIGRQSKGNEIQVPILTADPSMGRNHCVIRVTCGKQNEPVYTLRDFPSLTGTFVGNKCLGKNEQVRLHNGDVVTIGATTFIVNIPESGEA